MPLVAVQIMKGKQRRNKTPALLCMSCAPHLAGYKCTNKNLDLDNGKELVFPTDTKNTDQNV